MRLLEQLNQEATGKNRPFPGNPRWRPYYARCLQLAESHGQLDAYRPRLLGQPPKRDEAFAELHAAQIMIDMLDFGISDWHVRTVGGKDVDFLAIKHGQPVHCEVKDPRWEGELTKDERGCGRKALPKWLNGDARSVGPWRNVRYAIYKAYKKLLPDAMNLLIVVGHDLFVSPDEMNLRFALYYPSDDHCYDGLGYFADRRFERLGGVLVIDHRTPENCDLIYAENPHALHKPTPLISGRWHICADPRA